jgi:hypothetical protein
VGFEVGEGLIRISDIDFKGAKGFTQGGIRVGDNTVSLHLWKFLWVLIRDTGTGLSTFWEDISDTEERNRRKRTDRRGRGTIKTLIGNAWGMASVMPEKSYTVDLALIEKVASLWP